MNESSPPVPAELATQAVSFWDAQIRTIEKLAEEVAEEFTSKERLRRIALLALAQLMAMTQAAKAEEEMEREENAKDSGLLIPNHRIITP